MILPDPSRDRHSEVFDLLPWYANSSLPAEDRRRVEEHVESCDECARELSFLTGLSESMAGVEPLLVSAERSLGAVSARIDAVEAARGGRLGWPDVARIVGAKLSAGWLRPALATLVLLLVASGGWYWTTLSEPDFRTLSSAEASTASASGSMRLVFDGEATVDEMRTLLNELGVVLVSGPSRYGVYTARLDGPQDADRLARVLDRLRTEPVVAFAEPVFSPAAGGE